MVRPSNAATTRLDDDVLLSIFDTLTSEMPFLPKTKSTWLEIRPLKAIRTASQVCRQWRGLLLASPRIWGRLVDLQETSSPQRIRWAQEIIRRAGSAPLWVTGLIQELGKCSDSLDLPQLFLTILDSWERIEKISVCVRVGDKKILQEIQDRFLCRAPILKIFDVTFARDDDGLEDEDEEGEEEVRLGSSRPLFADYAPSLQAIRASQVSYRSNASWLSNLRDIDSFPRHFNMNEIFGVLQHTPLIERIIFDGIRLENRFWPWPGPEQVAFAKLSRPKLSTIEVGFTNLEVLAGIIEYLTPGTLFYLRVDVTDCGRWDLGHPSTMSSLEKNLPLYISSFTSTTSTFVKIQFGRKSFRICDFLKGAGPRSGFPYGFDITFTGSGLVYQEEWDTLLACILGAFIASGNSSFLGSATVLRVPVILFQPSTTERLYSFFNLFRNVQVLETDEQSGPTLFALSLLNRDQADVLFPHLHTLRLVSNKRRELPLNTDLTRFFIERKNIGLPVSKLDLTECRMSHYAQDLRELESLHGLEVVWINGRYRILDGICTYICGSGNPELLVNLVTNN